jgi:hypothetical protein
MKKDDYLPTHDEFYGDLSRKPAEYFGEICKQYHPGELGSLYTEKDVQFERMSYKDHHFEAGCKSKGIWDVVYKFDAKTKDSDRKRFSLCIEYKTSLEESDVNELLRQIKRRGPPEEIIEYNNVQWPVIRLLVTFDRRFEEYSAVIENEYIGLVVLPESRKGQVKEQFSDIKKAGNKTIGDF